MKSGDSSRFITVGKQFFALLIVWLVDSLRRVFIISGSDKRSRGVLILFCCQPFFRLFIPAVRKFFLTILIIFQGIIRRRRIQPLLFLPKCFRLGIKAGKQVFGTLGAVQKQRVGMIHLLRFGQIVILPLMNKVFIIAAGVISNPHCAVLIIAKAFQPGNAVLVIAAFRQRQRFAIQRQGGRVLIAAKAFQLLRRFLVLPLGHQILSGLIRSFRPAAGAEQEKGNKKKRHKQPFFLLHDEYLLSLRLSDLMSAVELWNHG